MKINNLKELKLEIKNNFKKLKLLYFYNNYEEDNKEALELIKNFLEENEKENIILFELNSENSLEIYKEYKIKQQYFLIFLNPDFSIYKEFDYFEPEEIFSSLEELEKQYSSNFDLISIKYQSILNIYKNSKESTIIYDSTIENENDIKLLNCRLVDVNKNNLDGWIQEITKFKLPISIFENKLYEGISENIVKKSKENNESFFEKMINTNMLLVFVNNKDNSIELQKKFDLNKLLYSRYLCENNKGVLEHLVKKFGDKSYYIFYNKELKLTNDSTDDEVNNLIKLMPKELKEYSIEDKLKSIINSFNIMIFMKGNPEEPKCGFSRKTIEILNSHNINYGHFDILQDNEVREQLKIYSNWKTYPQLYINGDLIGGIDILKEMDYDEIDELVSEYRK